MDLARTYCKPKNLKSSKASIFLFKDMFSNLLLKIIIYYDLDQPSIALFLRSVLNFELSLLTFLRSMT